ncbi:MAG: D-alanyl-D-alanine carboxypeptidase/D-alanyl-D-alanine-endopeptidase [Limisphaerales bacterium]
MTRRVAALVAAVAIWDAPVGRAGDPAEEELAAGLAAHVSHPRFQHATWGVAVAVTADGRRLWGTNAALLLQPASITKLFTGALALDLFGPLHRLETRVLARGFPDRRGRVHGGLLVIGAGDFSFAARFHDGRQERSLDGLADAIVAAGVRSVDGGLLGDDGAFRGPRLGAGWAWDDLQFYYGAEPSALAAEDNVLDLAIRPGTGVGVPCVIEPKPRLVPFELRNETSTAATNGTRDITIERPLRGGPVTIRGGLPLGGRPWTDAVAVPQPAAWFLDLLHAELAERGVAVRGANRVLSGRPDEAVSRVEIARVPSPPMGDLVRLMMKPSQNLYAHTLVLLAGNQVDAAAESSAGAGLRAMVEFCTRLGIPAGTMRLEEGAGLSRGSMLTAGAVLALLQAMDRHPAREAFLAALPVAGVDGTLRSRFRAGPARGNLAAKTGTLTGVHALSGFVTNAAGTRLTFSILLNHYSAGTGDPSGREAVDALAERIAASRAP